MTPSTSHDAPIAAAEVSLARIVAQRLARNPAATPGETIAWLGCLQAQDLPGALTSLALRTEATDQQVVDAFNDATVVRSWPMRGTLHLVHGADVGWMSEVTAPRMDAKAAKRRQNLGIDEAMIERAGALVESAYAEVGPLTRSEIVSLWEPDGFSEVAGRAYHLLHLLCYRGLLVQGPLRGREQCFVTQADWITEPRVPADREQALAWWATAYFRSHGPATIKDFTRWTDLTTKDARLGIAAAGAALLARRIDGVEHWMDPALPDRLAEHREQAGRVLLLPGFDELILGYRDRSATVAPEHEQFLAPGGNGVFRPTVISAGRVVGTWRRSGDAIAAVGMADRLPDPEVLQPLLDELPRPLG
ncbi:winged helix DNA-binding domain-containing protein [Granulicoccus phenolivorans]|uniref:winged helix DNA-binding domain-containing protein n=1 Tax=Granulicoccus phenolivorans TaxID=266854 RepID=UPI0004144708|nr:winged helix DNA-binding domain-containing protein [Granulicoccus phenolivorans]